MFRDFLLFSVQHTILISPRQFHLETRLRLTHFTHIRDRNRKLRLCPTDYRKVDFDTQGKWPVYFCFLNSFCTWFASKEQSRILIRYQYFFCNRKTRWQLPLYSEINLNVRIYHGKYDTFVSIEILSASFKIIISTRWNVILNAVNVLISSLTLGNHISV